jgi:hypothetical protein
MTTVHVTCPLRQASYRLDTIDDSQRVTRVQGDIADVFSRDNLRLRPIIEQARPRRRGDVRGKPFGT